MLKTICVLVLFGLAHTSTSNSNSYIERLLHTDLPNEVRSSNIDPAKLSNFTTLDKDSVLGVKVNVNMEYYNGQMTGMLRVQRSENCPPSRRDYGNVTLNCTLVFRDIKIKYDAKLKYGRVPSTSVKAEAGMSPSYAFVEFTSDANHNRPFLKRTHLTQTGSFTADISGLGPLNSSLKKIVKDKFLGHVAADFFNIFTYNFVPALGRATKSSSLPLP